MILMPVSKKSMPANGVVDIYIYILATDNFLAGNIKMKSAQDIPYQQDVYGVGNEFPSTLSNF